MANLGVSPADFSSDVGKVRILLGDTEAENVVNGIGEYLYFSDAELSGILEMYGDNVKLAAARGIEIIAGSQALLLKSWSSDDLAVNGDRIAESLRKIAAQLREEAIAEESSGYFNLIAMYVDNDENGFADEFKWWN